MDNIFLVVIFVLSHDPSTGRKNNQRHDKNDNIRISRSVTTPPPVEGIINHRLAENAGGDSVTTPPPVEGIINRHPPKKNCPVVTTPPPVEGIINFPRTTLRRLR